MSVNFPEVNTWLLILTAIPIAITLVVYLVRTIKATGRQSEWERDANRRLDRLEHHVGFWKQQQHNGESDD